MALVSDYYKGFSDGSVEEEDPFYMIIVIVIKFIAQLDVQ